MGKVIIYTDGGAVPNPGRGGYGVVLRAGKHRKELSGGFRYTTNNRMELIAAIVALEALKRPCEVILYSDSQYLINAINQGWLEGWQTQNWTRRTKPIPNADLWQRLIMAMQPHDIDWQWVKGHAGVADNECCDQLATAALQQSDLPVDTGYVDVAV